MYQTHPTLMQVKAGNGFEYYVRHFGKITNHETIWAADTFALFSSGFFLATVDTVSYLVDKAKGSASRKIIDRDHLSKMMDALEWCGHIFVPGFDEEKVSDWRLEVREAIELGVGTFELGEELGLY